MTCFAEADAAHAAVLARLASADSRVAATCAVLSCALADREALARLAGKSAGMPVSVSVTAAPTDVATSIHEHMLGDKFRGATVIPFIPHAIGHSAA